MKRLIAFYQQYYTFYVYRKFTYSILITPNSLLHINNNFKIIKMKIPLKKPSDQVLINSFQTVEKLK